MKRITFKSVLSIVLCSIVAMLAISCSKDIVQENEFETIEFYAKEGQLPRWQEQLQWISDTFEDVFPDLKLVGWRSIGSLNSQTEIEKFIEEGLQDNKFFGHTIDAENRVYEVAPRSELNQKYGVWNENATAILKKQFKDKMPIGANIIELRWIYKGEEYIEKIAVSNEIDELGNAIRFSTISQFILTKNTPLADWQIKDINQRKQEIMTPEKQNLVELCIKKLKSKTTRTGIDGEEEPRNLYHASSHHSYLSPYRINGASVCDVELIFVTQFDMNALAFDAWDVVIVKHNSTTGHQCDTDAVLTYGIKGVSASATHKWGYTWAFIGYTETERVVDVSRGTDCLYFSHIENQYISDDISVLCPIPESNK